MIFERIKALCEQRGITIHQLEVESGLGNATVRGWEDRCSPSVISLKKVADYFGVTMDSLMGGEQNEHPRDQDEPEPVCADAD